MGAIKLNIICISDNRYNQETESFQAMGEYKMKIIVDQGLNPEEPHMLLSQEVAHMNVLVLRSSNTNTEHSLVLEAI